MQGVGCLYRDFSYTITNCWNAGNAEQEFDTYGETNLKLTISDFKDMEESCQITYLVPVKQKILWQLKTMNFIFQRFVLF